MKKQKSNPEDATRLRQRAEKKLKQQKPQTNKAVSEADMLKLIHELQVHQIELELQNEELVIAKEKAELAEEKYTSLFDFAPTAYFNLTPDGNISELNLAGAKMLGKERRNLVKSRLAFFTSRDTRAVFDDFLSQLFIGKSPASCEVAFVNGGDAPIYAYLGGTVAGDGKHCLITAVDITGRKAAEEELKTGDRIFKHSLDMLCIAGFDGYFKVLNPAWTKVLGWSKEELLSKPWIDFVHPDDRDNTKDIKTVIVDGKEIYQFENRYMCKDGTIKWLSWNSFPYPEENIMFGVARDVTVSKQRELTIYNFFEQPLNINIITDFDGKINRSNSGWEIYLGYQKDEIIGNNFFDFIHPDDISITIEEMKKLEKGISTLHFENRYRHKNGEYRKLEWSAIPSPDEHLIYAVAIDITERKQAEKTKQVLFQIANEVLHSFKLDDFIKAVEQQLSQLFDTTNFYIALYDSETGMLSAPFEKDKKDQIDTWPAKASATGLVIEKKKSVMLQKQDILRLIGSSEIEQTGSICESWLGVPLFKGTDVSGVIVVQSYDNPETFDSNTIELFEYVSNQISMALERTRFFEDLITAKEKAEESDRLKTAFINNISHEVRTPLNGILGFGHLIMEEGLSEKEKQEYYKVLRDSSKRLQDTIRDIMDISQLTAGSIKPAPAGVHLGQLMNNMLEKTQLACAKRNILVTLKSPEQYDNLVLQTDGELLAKILSHLLNNAEKFTSEGRITLGFEVKDKWVEIFVSDTGKGIATDKLDAVFEPFMQEDVSVTRGHEGSGLGLTIAMHVAELLGGKLWAESEKGKGSTFFFTLPYVPVEGKPEQAEDIAVKPTVAGKALVLIAEDEESSYLLMKTMVQKAGFVSLHAFNGAEAVELCREYPEIGLILMDIKMPVMDGLEATARIKAFRPDLPVIALTAHAQIGDRQRMLDAGCDEYMAKPVKLEALNAMIKKIIT